MTTEPATALICLCGSCQRSSVVSRLCTECHAQAVNGANTHEGCSACTHPTTPVPKLPWAYTHDMPGLRYYQAQLFDCTLYITPHGWDVYYAPSKERIREQHHVFIDVPLPSVDECKIQAEQAARELMQGLKDSGQFEAWAALWGDS